MRLYQLFRKIKYQMTDPPPHQNLVLAWLRWIQRTRYIGLIITLLLPTQVLIQAVQLVDSMITEVTASSLSSRGSIGSVYRWCRGELVAGESCPGAEEAHETVHTVATTVAATLEKSSSARALRV